MFYVSVYFQVENNIYDRNNNLNAIYVYLGINLALQKVYIKYFLKANETSTKIIKYINTTLDRKIIFKLKEIYVTNNKLQN